MVRQIRRNIKHREKNKDKYSIEKDVIKQVNYTSFKEMLPLFLLGLLDDTSNFKPENVLSEFYIFLSTNSDISLNSINQLICVIVKCYVFFAVRAELLNIN
jgi:hypothetical protein